MSHDAPATTAATTSQPDRICPECEARVVETICPTCKVSTIPASVLDKAEDPLLGQALQGKYRVESILGQGGMGTVYRGTQMSIDREVAIKVVSREFSSDLESIKRFQREAKITSKLTHPNTIRLYDFGLTEGGQLFLVMELLQGHELADELGEGRRMSLRRAVDICVQVLRALREAHNLDIVHRDLKPANIFLQKVEGEGDLAKVMDFGIAKTVEGDNISKVTKTGMLVGTPAYMSPEQARGDFVGPASDIYAVGMIFYELLAGRVPFVADTPVATLLAQITQAPPPITRFRTDLPNADAVQRVLNVLLAKRSDQRPQDAGAAAAMLQELLTEGGGDQPGDADVNDATVMIEAISGPQLRAHSERMAQAGAAGLGIDGDTALEALDAATEEGRAGAPPVTAAYGSPPASGATSVTAGTVVQAGLTTEQIAEPEVPAGGRKTGLLLAAAAVLLAAGVGAAFVVSGSGGEGAGVQAAEVTAGESAEDPAQAKGDNAQGAEAEDPAKEAAEAAAVARAAAEAKAAAEKVAALEKAAAAAKAAAQVKVTIVSTPPGASVFTGGRALGVTPLKLSSPVKGSRLVLEVSARDHKPASVTVEGGQSGEIPVTLEKLPTQPKPVARPEPPKVDKPAAAKPAKKPTKRSDDSEAFMLD